MQLLAKIRQSLVEINGLQNPSHPRMVYLHTFGRSLWVNVGKYDNMPYMDATGYIPYFPDRLTIEMNAYCLPRSSLDLSQQCN